LKLFLVFLLVLDDVLVSSEATLSCVEIPSPDAPPPFELVGLLDFLDTLDLR